MPAEQPDGTPTSALPQPPVYIQNDPELVELFHTTMRDLINQARGLPMHTVQEFLLERIVTMYVTMRWREQHGNWHELGIRAQTIYTNDWLNMVKEWNRVLASGQQQIREQIMAEVEKILHDGLETVQDDETRKNLRRFFKESFANIGM